MEYSRVTDICRVLCIFVIISTRSPFDSRKSFFSEHGRMNLNQVINWPTRYNILNLSLTSAPEIISLISYSDGLSDSKTIVIDLQLCIHIKMTTTKTIRDYSCSVTCAYLYDLQYI